MDSEDIMADHIDGGAATDTLARFYLARVWGRDLLTRMEADRVRHESISGR